ncbi:MAG: restriction endonuclease subunit S [Candidatus Contendobacter sp.]|nr:restriction endonuclease subunit S [Candidatus Contendobacter sp.]
MSDLRRLDEIVQKVNDKITFKKDLSKPYVGLEHIGTRSSYLSGFSEANTSISTNAVFSAGDVLFGKLRPNLRKCVVAPFDGYCSTDILVLRANSDVCNRFVGRVFQTEKVGSAAEMTAIGTKMPRTSWTHLKEVEVYYPDRHSQEVIANILDTLDTTIRQTEAIIAKLQQVKQGLLHDLLTRGIDANGQLRPPVEQAPHLYKESPLGWIPMEWEVGPLSYCVASLDAGVSVNAEDRPHGSSEIGVLKTSAISNGVFYPEQNKTVISREIGLVREPVRADSILVSRMNTPLLVGESCYVDVDSPSLFLPDRIWQLKIRDSSVVQTKWLSYIFRTSRYRAYVEIHATGTSGSMKNLPKSRLLGMPVAFPKFREQLQTSNRMTAIDQRINAERANLRKLINEKSALMDDLLTGRVRVTSLLAQVDASS